jgi:hypothetical protein
LPSTGFWLEVSLTSSFFLFSLPKHFFQ